MYDSLFGRAEIEEASDKNGIFINIYIHYCRNVYSNN